MPEREDKYQQYLDEKHAKWHVPTGHLHQFFLQGTGQQATSFDRVVKGGGNEVYFATTASGDEFVVRILREHRDGTPGGAAEEAWCLNSCQQAGLPVPRVIALDTIESEDQKLEALILTKLSGSPFADLRPSLSPQQIAIGHAQMGAALAHLHTIKVGGYYRRDPEDGVWDYPDAKASREDLYQSRSADAPHLLAAGFSAADIDRALECITQYAEQVQGPEPVLCHGDFGRGHIFLDDALQLTGIIDFGLYAGDHPVSDFATLSMDMDAGTLDAIGAGYGAAYDEQFIHWINLRKVPMLIGYLAHHIQIPNHPETPGYIASLRAALAAL